MAKELILDESNDNKTRILLNQKGEIIKEETRELNNVALCVNGVSSQWENCKITERKKV